MPMRKSVVGLAALAGALCTLATAASTGLEIIAMEGPAWTEHVDSRTPVETGDRVRQGDRLLTGSTGKLDLRLDSGVSLQLDFDSEIEFLKGADTGAESEGFRFAAKIHRGRLCVQFRTRPDTATSFGLLLGDTVSANIHEQGHICAVYTSDEARIVLVGGSVQISNHIEPTLVVLSEPASEYNFDNAGNFTLSTVENEISIRVSNAAEGLPDSKRPAETSAGSTETVDREESGAKGKDAIEIPAPDNNGTKNEFIYTVYLFSTRSREAADKVNRKLQRAGHQTLIITSDDSADRQYRIAVPGFSTPRAAQDYAADIVGKYGIGDTWIGRTKVIE